MIYHFSIAPFGGIEVAAPKILLRAQRDPRILHLEGEKGNHVFVFCYSPESADFERYRFEERGTVSPSLCMLAMDEFGIQVNQEGSDDSRKLMAPFVLWILRSFSPCRVFDDDTEQEVSQLVWDNPQVLFE